MKLRTLRHQTEIKEHIDCPTLKSEEFLIQWLSKGPTRTFSKITDSGLEEILFEDINKGDKFVAFDDGIPIENENGSTEFLATSWAYMWQGIPIIDVKGL